MNTYSVVKAELHSGLFSKRKKNMDYLLKTRPDIFLIENGTFHEKFLRKWARKNHWKFSDEHMSSADSVVFLYRKEDVVNSFVRGPWKSRNPFYLNPLDLNGKDAAVFCKWRS